MRRVYTINGVSVNLMRITQNENIQLLSELAEVLLTI